MKKDIHPKYYNKTKVTCSCGAKFSFGSTSTALRSEICSQCHPFYTGQQKIVDTAGRVERFKQKQEAAARHQKKITEGTEKSEEAENMEEIEKTEKKGKGESKKESKKSKSTKKAA